MSLVPWKLALRILGSLKALLAEIEGQGTRTLGAQAELNNEIRALEIAIRDGVLSAAPLGRAMSVLASVGEAAAQQQRAVTVDTIPGVGKRLVSCEHGIRTGESCPECDKADEEALP